MGASRGADLALALEGLGNFPLQLSLDSSDIEVMLWSGAPFRGRVGFLRQLDQARENHRDSFEGLDNDALCTRASEIFEEVFSDLLDAVDPQRTKTHYLPLTGGRDSGTILAFLLRSVPRHNIVAITYRNPQPFSEIDFMVGQARAKAARIRHLAFDVRTLPLTTSMVLQAMELTGSAKVFGTTNIVHGYMGIDDPDAVYWTGFMGGSLNRLLLPAHIELGDSGDPKQAFAKAFSNGPDPSNMPYGLPQEPFLGNSPIHFVRQLNIVTRQDFRIQEGRFSRNHVWVAPFLHSRWAGFALNWTRENLTSDVSSKIVRDNLRDALGDRDPAEKLSARVTKRYQALAKRARGPMSRILGSGYLSDLPVPSKNLVRENLSDVSSRPVFANLLDRIQAQKEDSAGLSRENLRMQEWLVELELGLKSGLKVINP